MNFLPEKRFDYSISRGMMSTLSTDNFADLISSRRLRIHMISDRIRSWNEILDVHLTLWSVAPISEYWKLHIETKSRDCQHRTSWSTLTITINPHLSLQGFCCPAKLCMVLASVVRSTLCQLYRRINIISSDSNISFLPLSTTRITTPLFLQLQIRGSESLILR